MSPGGKKIELFGRPDNCMPGWLTLGNQLADVRLSDRQIIARYKKAYPQQDISEERMEKNLEEMSSQDNLHKIYNNHIQKNTGWDLSCLSFYLFSLLQSSLQLCNKHIMLLRGNKQPQKIHDFMLKSPLSRSPHANTALPVRHSMTAKSKMRVKTPAANKTISTRPEGHNTSAPGKLNMENSSEMLPNSTFAFYNNQPALSNFDNLQL